MSEAEENPASPIRQYFVGDISKKEDRLKHEDFEEEYIAFRKVKAGDHVFVLRSNSKWTYAKVKAKTEGHADSETRITLIVNSKGDTKEVPFDKWSKYIRLPRHGSNARPSLKKLSNAFMSMSTRALTGDADDDGDEDSVPPGEALIPPFEIKYKRCSSVYTTSTPSSSFQFTESKTSQRKSKSFRYSEPDDSNGPNNRRHIGGGMTAKKSKSFNDAAHEKVQRSHNLGAMGLPDQDLKARQKSFLNALRSINHEAPKKNLGVSFRYGAMAA